MKRKDSLDLNNSFISALKTLGGAASINEIIERLIIDFDINQYHQNNFRVLINNVRDELINDSIIESSQNQILTITRKGLYKNKKKPLLTVELNNKPNNSVETSEKDKLLTKLQNLNPKAFEILCLRFLKEIGFRNLEHTGKVNDGGFDGFGSFVFNEVISFDVLIQAKRFKNTIGSSIIRDFRGAMSGRTDKGLMITTGVFSASALQEANRDGAVKIDLIDGEFLCEKLIQLNLGVKKKIIQEIRIDEEWFNNL